MAGSSHRGPKTEDRRTEGLVRALVKDGRPLLTFTGLALLFSGCFAVFLSAKGEFLPHDLAFLGPSAVAIESLAEGRVARFMFHDRVAFGGALLAIGVLYLWLVEFPLRRGERWAWRAFLASGVVGFASFLTYLGYGYLDSWHGAATLALLPLFVAGLALSRRTLTRAQSEAADWGRKAASGRRLLLATGVGMLLAGVTIMALGMTTVFVPQDLRFMGVTPDDLYAANPRLIPLIAHDRAGFGGAIASCGVLVVFCARYGRPSRGLWQALAVSGLCGFGAAIGVHFVVGYVDHVHLGPAYAGLALYLLGLGLSVRGSRGS